MYRGFNLKLPGLSFDEPYLSKVRKIGSEINREHQGKVQDALDDFMTDNGELNASKMRANWFPQIESDIFISHSHRDESRAILLSGWLKDAFGLTAFVDSCAWGHSNRLLKLIDSKYCQDKDSKLYDYGRRNLSTSHVYMMLSSALSKMIDQCECLFFM